MSQQGPGGYGGGGPYGPPGGGGYGGPPPGGGGYPPPGGAPPGGYGPPGGPPGYGGPPPGSPPGYGPPQQGYGGYPAGPPAGPAAPPPKKSKALLFVGLGCGALILLGVAASVASYFYMKSKVNDAETAIANLAAGGTSPLAAPAPGSVSAACAKTIACCKAVTGKAAVGNPALVEQSCNGFALLSDAQCEQQYSSLKLSAAAVHATCE
jgi:hypothetical protein